MSISIPSGLRSVGAGNSRRRRRRLDFTRSSPFFVGLLLLAVVAFWPTYLSRLGASTPYTHLHAFTATLWIVLLIAQPAAVRSGNLAWHRTLGQLAYGLAPLLVLTVVLLAHSDIVGLEGRAFVDQSYLLYLRISLAGLFSLTAGLALITRRTTALHARFMVCTAFPLIDPVLSRMMRWIEPNPTWNYQWFTFALTDLVILAAVWWDRGNHRGRWVFPAILPLFVLTQLPALWGLTETSVWQLLSRWFAALPLT